MHSMRKRLMVTLLLIAIMASVFCLTVQAEETESVHEPVCYIHGDVNGDGIVNSRDAIYVLYHVTISEDSYPINQDQNCDFSADAKTDAKDAIWLLYAALNMPSHDLNGTIHTYYDPVWSWDISETGATAEAVFTCSCGNTESVSANVTCLPTAPTCTAAGSKDYTATVEFGGETITNEYSVEIEPAGHSMVSIEGCICTQHSKCENCDYETAPIGHSYITETAPATCQKPAVQTTTCENCDFISTVTLDGLADCNFVFVSVEDVQLDATNSPCLWTKKSTYQCSICSAEKVEDTETYANHSYTATLTREPTCAVPGEKISTCSVCGDSYTEAVPNPDAHIWDDGAVAEDGSITYTCSVCGETKITVSADANGTVSKAALEAVSEVQLADNTAIAMDSTVVENLAGDVAITVTSTSVAELPVSISDAQKEQIGNNPVYDFNMKYVETEEAVSNFDGQVTISLPYTLEEGEDIDSINVWFIADDGTLTAIDGTYANGYVTFTTSHFSYYTVTRLKPAERCALYGHMNAEVKRTPTCTSDGYTATVCQRCGQKTSETVIPATGHHYQESLEDLTCTTPGILTRSCKNCTHKEVSTVPAPGHKLVEDESQYVAPTCSAPGRKVSVCDNRGCSYQHIEELAQLPHQYVDEKKNASCNSNGHHKKVCSICGAEQFIDETAPTGHHYTQENARWEWAEDYSWAKVTLVCAYHPDAESHTKELNAVVTCKNTELTSCEEGRTVIYSASAAFNKWVYTDEVTVVLAPGQHQSGNVWYSNADQHFYKCTLCKQPLSPADHTWDENTITPATCGEAGTAVYECQICGYEKTETLPATGEHTYEDGKCSVCGTPEIECNHVKLTERTVDLSGYDLCGHPEFKVRSCDCGKQAVVTLMSHGCSMENSMEENVQDGYNNWQVVQTEHCNECGLTIEYGYGNVMDIENCCYRYSDFTKITVGDSVILDALWSDYDFDLLSRHPGTILIETIDLSEYGICSEKINVYKCVCGEVTTYSGSGCRWEYVNNSNNVTTYKCSKCDAIRTSKEEYNMQPDLDQFITTYTYYVNDEKIYEYQRINSTYYHDWEFVDYELHGDSCTDGFTLYQECKNCGETKEVYQTYHMTFIREEIILNNPLICGNKFVKSTCPCGKQATGNFEGTTSFCWNYEWQSHDDVSGTDTYTCTSCKSIKVEKVISEKDKNCNVFKITESDYYDREGTFLLSFSQKSSYLQHIYTVTDAKLFESACNEGIRITETCSDCGITRSYNSHSHDTYKTQVLDFSKYDDVCSGTVTQNECLCGKEFNSIHNYSCNYVWQYGWDEEDENGVMHHYERYECSACGTYYEMHSYPGIPEHPCFPVFIGEFTFFLKDGTCLGTFRDRTTSQEHDDVIVYSLQPNSETCDQGLIATTTCSRCDRSYTNYYWGHAMNTVETIDLTKYGSVCGGTMKHLKCPCGAQERFDFSDDVLCDLEQVSTPVWIDGAISGSQWTTNNSLNYFGGNAYIFTCAVTDPQQCGLKIRMAEYWLQEDNCAAKEYQTWQLGYDERSNTWDKEITVATGESQTRHPYEKTVTQGTTDDGTYLHCTTEICPDCGSSCEIKFWYPNSTMQANIKYQRNVINTLDNGMNKQFTYTWCDDLIYAGYRYRTLELLEYVNSNGSTYWDRYDYTYDFPAGCVRMTAYSNSNGGSSTSTGTDHRKSYVNQYDPSTCTQYGTQYQGQKCNVCGHTDSAVTQLKPKAHNWIWNSTLQTYICSYCDLKNSNGASGQIVMEDLTDSHGGGTDYVIGYWNRGGISFTPVVQIVLDDATEDQDNLLSLATPIDFTYRQDVVAVSCNKAAVQTAVSAALVQAGYSGSYAVRIIFLPASPTGELDYAITFDSQTTN